MIEFQLNATSREQDGKATRKSGKIPAVIYGNNVKNLSVAVDKIQFNRLYKEAGTSHLVDIVVDGDKPAKTLIHDIQLDPITLGPIHIDFLKVNMKEKIHAEIPLNFINQSPAVVDQEGTLITAKDAVEVECLPSDLPPEINIDLSVLVDFENDIRVSDLVIPTGVEILDEGDDIIAHVEPPRSEEEIEADLATPIEEDVSKVEVEAEKKEEGEGESAEQSEEK